MNSNKQSSSFDALTALSLLDVLKIIPQGQKYLFVSEDDTQNVGVVLSRQDMEDLTQECIWLAQHPDTPSFHKQHNPVWSRLASQGVVELYASQPHKPHMLLNPRNDCAVSMTPSMWQGLVQALKDMPEASAHTPMDEAILSGLLNGTPAHKIQKAFEWCQTRQVDPWEMSKEGTPEWMKIVESMDQLNQAPPPPLIPQEGLSPASKRKP